MKIKLYTIYLISFDAAISSWLNCIIQLSISRLIRFSSFPRKVLFPLVKLRKIKYYLSLFVNLIAIFFTFVFIFINSPVVVVVSEKKKTKKQKLISWCLKTLHFFASIFFLRFCIYVCTGTGTGTHNSIFILFISIYIRKVGILSAAQTDLSILPKMKNKIIKIQRNSTEQKYFTFHLLTFLLPIVDILYKTKKRKFLKLELLVT